MNCLWFNIPHFSLYSWLKQAIDFGTTPQDKELALRNAKEQITIWGPYDPKTNLHDDAFKDWGTIKLVVFREMKTF